MRPDSIPLDAFYEAVVLTDANYRVVDCNARAVELFRAKDKAALLGRNASEIPSNHDLSGEFPTYLRERLTAVPFVILESRVPRDDGTSFIGETAIHLINADSILFSIRDITVKAESLKRLEEANERLRATDRDRIEFVSNVSHELRTPLTSMSYALTNMRRGICGQLPEKATAYLERLQVDVRRLMTTVNDILDLRQMENGTLTLHKTTVPLGKVLAEAGESLAIQAETKHQTLTVEPTEPEIYAEADAHKIERVFFNILSNAVKYTPEGGAIHASVHSDGTTASIQVDDNGIGIPPEALPRVSQRFFRVGDQVAGTGLGLSIVREIVELHGGKLHILSPVPGTDKGTRVSVEIPTCPGPLQVIVSGDPDFIQRVQNAATSIGLSTYVDSDAIDIAKECRELHPARFILDAALPDTCLCDLICQIRGDAALAQAPILMLAPEADPTRRSDYARMRATLALLPTTDAECAALLKK